GGAAPDTVPDREWAGPAPGDLLGTSVAGAGDVNGDGRADMLVGIPGANNGPTLDTGRAQLYLGALPPPLMPAFSVLGTVPYGELGLSVAGIGDVNVAGVRLSAPRPNPAIAFVSLAINLERAARIDLEIVDLAGRRVGRLASGVLPPGRHEFSWPSRRGSRLPAGVYSAVLRAEG